MGTSEPATAIYKRQLAAILERRPSGTRQRLALALGKHRSFISQITNPAYATPVPASHLDVIFELCHFSPSEQQQFLAAYRKAHPRRARPREEKPAGLSITLPDLGDDNRNRKLQVLVGRFVEQLAALLTHGETEGKAQ